MSDLSRPDDFTIDGEVFQVLINAEAQFSIWQAGQAAPEGWSRTGPVGPKAGCLAHVEAQWLDMRPKSSGTAWPRPPAAAKPDGRHVGLPAAATGRPGRLCPSAGPPPPA